MILFLFSFIAIVFMLLWINMLTIECMNAMMKSFPRDYNPSASSLMKIICIVLSSIGWAGVIICF